METVAIDDIVNIIVDFIHPKRIILFGSRATGKNKQYSDFDIAVEGAEMDIRKERLLKEAFDKKLGIFTVELINLDKIDKEFKKLILETGEVVYG